MIIKVPLYIKNEDWIKLVKSMTMKMLKTVMKTYNSMEFSNESFENLSFFWPKSLKNNCEGVHFYYLY